jgi:hypothetical protein
VLKVSTKGSHMRRYLLLATAGTLAALVATAPAAAKGPSTATLTGPGLGHALAVEGDGETGAGSPLASLVELGGFFPQMFLETPDPTVKSPPAGDLGPRYHIVYRVPGPHGVSTLVQDVYPYATTPVTHMSPGQRFWGSSRTHGGWFVSGPGLRATLVAAGLPDSPPVSGGSFPWAWAGAGAGAIAVVVLLGVMLRRHRIVRFRTVRTTA